MAGLGSAVSEVLAPLQTGCKQISIGTQDVFGQCGKPKELPMRSKKRACKLIVCDLDGTLLDEQKQMDPKFLRVM